MLLDDDEDTLYSVGTETLRREGCDRTVLTGPPQYDDEDQGGAVYMWGSYWPVLGAPEAAGSDPGQARDVQPVCGQEGTGQAHDNRHQTLQDGEQGHTLTCLNVSYYDQPASV